jgi:hypothetical protein
MGTQPFYVPVIMESKTILAEQSASSRYRAVVDMLVERYPNNSRILPLPPP